jgi:hypothetical protein
MTNFDHGLEQWLRAERQQMTSAAQTAYLNKKSEMLAANIFKPNDTRNRGATKSRSHIGVCAQYINTLESADFTPLEQCKQLGVLASKAFKVASGYAMRAGYFHPSEPAGLYRNRVVRLIDANGDRLPVLGRPVATLAEIGLAAATTDAPQTVGDLRPLFAAGQEEAKQADDALWDLYRAELGRDSTFSGTEESQRTADELTLVTKGLFVALGIGALQLQGSDGPDGLGPLILEPKSDTTANYYLRAERLSVTTVGQTTLVSSADALPRT